MSKEDLRSVLNFVKEHGAVLESTVWKEFVLNETIEERARVAMLIEELNYKGLIEHAYNKRGHCVVKYAMNDYQ